MVSFCISTNIQTAARTLGGEEASLKRSQPCSPRASFLAGGLEMGPQTIAMSIQCAAGTPDADQCRNAITKTTGLRTLGPVLRIRELTLHHLAAPGAHTAPGRERAAPLPAAQAQREEQRPRPGRPQPGLTQGPCRPLSLLVPLQLSTLRHPHPPHGFCPGIQSLASSLLTRLLPGSVQNNPER